MPLQYLDGDSQDLYNVKRMGSTFSDAIIGMAEMRAKRGQQQQQALRENQYLQLAREKEMREAASSKSLIQSHESTARKNNQTSELAMQTAQRAQGIGRLRGQSELGPEGIMSIVQDEQAGPKLFDDLRTAGVYPQGNMQTNPQELLKRIAMAIHGQVYGEAASNPASAERLSRPVISKPNDVARDPIDLSQILFQNDPAPMSPFQQAEVDLHQGQGRDLNASRAATLAEQTRYHNQLLAKQKPKTSDQEMRDRIDEKRRAKEGGSPTKVSSQQEYDALPSGAKYVDDSGHVKVKGVK